MLCHRSPGARPRVDALEGAGERGDLRYQLSAYLEWSPCCSPATSATRVAAPGGRRPATDGCSSSCATGWSLPKRPTGHWCRRSDNSATTSSSSSSSRSPHPPPWGRWPALRCRDPGRQVRHVALDAGGRAGDRGPRAHREDHRAARRHVRADHGRSHLPGAQRVTAMPPTIPTIDQPPGGGHHATATHPPAPAVHGDHRGGRQLMTATLPASDPCRTIAIQPHSRSWGRVAGAGAVVRGRRRGGGGDRRDRVGEDPRPGEHRSGGARSALMPVDRGSRR